MAMTSTTNENATLLHAKEWARLDPNPSTSHHVQKLISQIEDKSNESKSSSRDAAFQELHSFFPANDRIGFGTAGLRGHMQPGPMGMNDLIVIQTAQGLARNILRNNNNNNTKDSPPLKAVVAYDHRSHSTFDLSSKNFAIYTKLVFEHAGIPCTLLDGYVATPILAFAVSNINAAVGIMVTASHNPKQDDGYKVYWNDGCQIRPPTDEHIANDILEEESLVPWIEYGEKRKEWEAKAMEHENGMPSGDCYGLSDVEGTEKIVDAYFQAVLSSGLVVTPGMIDGEASTSLSPPRIAYTAMHGVGYPFALRSFQTFKLPPFLAVPSQRDPDPNFSTVPFPNPEEKGALDEAMAFALEQKCDVVLANDPDADRLGVAEFERDSRKWTVFTGDQIGTLLGFWLWDTIGRNSDRVSVYVSILEKECVSVICSSLRHHFSAWYCSLIMLVVTRNHFFLLHHHTHHSK